MKERKFLSVFVCLLMVAAVFAVGVPVNVVAEEPGEHLGLPEEPGDPGSEGEGEWWVEGNGNYFELTNSEYLNITMTSSENVWVRLESVPKVVSFEIEADCPATTTEVILTGFEPSKTYYRYQDGELQESFTYGVESSYSFTQDISTSHHVFIQETMSTIYIYQDGTVSDPTKISRDGEIYTQIDNIEESIYILRSGITLIGDDMFSITGSDTYGIYTFKKPGITITNVAVSGFSFGIFVGGSIDSTVSDSTTSSNSQIGIVVNSGTLGGTSTAIGNIVSNCGSIGIGVGGNICIVSGNQVSNSQRNGINVNSPGGGNIIENTVLNAPGYGILINPLNGGTIGDNIVSGSIDGAGITFFGEGGNTAVSGNTVSNSHYGILYYSTLYSGDTLRNNVMADNTYNFYTLPLSHDIDNSNMVDGKPIIFIVGEENLIIDSSTNAGYVGVVNSNHITIRDLTITKNGQGILLGYTTDCTIQNVDVSACLYGFWLFESERNIMNGNTLSYNRFGIYISYNSNDNTVSGNTFSNDKTSIYVYGESNYNTINGNMISYSYHNGISLDRSWYCTVSSNNIVSSTYDGMTVLGNFHTICGNIIENPGSRGISVGGASLYDYGDHCISENTIINANYGISMSWTYRNTICGNDVSYSYIGIWFNGYADNNNIVGNTIWENTYGLRVYFSNNNNIYHNNFDNPLPLYHNLYSMNTWDNGEGEGNYWSEYTGEDIGGMTYPWDEIEKHLIADDGVGDTIVPHPYEGIDYYPLMFPYNPNQPPIAIAGGPYTGYEGSEITFDASGSSDPDDDPLQFRWDFDNNGIWDTDWIDNPTTPNTWNDDYSGTVAVEVSDGALTATATSEVTIDNADPIITSITSPFDPSQINTIVGISCDFEDPGILDTHTALIDWDDGTPNTPGIVTEIGGIGSASGSHPYETPGVYMVTIYIFDDDGGMASATTEYVVVYDPTGAFVTGGGMIDSPIGAIPDQPDVTGKAGFGFVSKYQKGAMIPDGNTQFRFQAADIKFQSDSYDWLVVAGPKAMFKGTGTINGGGNYGFLISAVDGDMPGGNGVDKFRIKIWDKDNFDTVVYDNGLGDAEDADPQTELTHGSIKIHKA